MSSITTLQSSQSLNQITTATKRTRVKNNRSQADQSVDNDNNEFNEGYDYVGLDESYQISTGLIQPGELKIKSLLRCHSLKTFLNNYKLVICPDCLGEFDAKSLDL